MGFIILGLYIIAVTALVLGIYVYISIQDLNKTKKSEIQIRQRIENRLYSLEKILNNKKWTWK